MDSTDFSLLVALHENARQSYRALGRRASLSAPATGDRLERLKSRSIILGFWLSINPKILGAVRHACILSGRSYKRASREGCFIARNGLGCAKIGRRNDRSAPDQRAEASYIHSKIGKSCWQTERRNGLLRIGLHTSSKLQTREIRLADNGSTG